MSKKTNRPNFIPDAFYSKIIKVLPIVSVEALIVVDDSLLFLKRKNEPVKGQWWFPGGRIRMGESLEQTLCREIFEETGLKLSDYKLFNVYSRVFPERHDITIAYVCRCERDKVKIDPEHSEYAFFSKPPVGLHPYLAQTIADSHWKEF
jgi:colanic acid biosynthesis protein WcaH